VNEILQHLKILDSLDWKSLAATAVRVFVILALAMIAISMLNRVSRLFREHIMHRIHDAEQIKRGETLALAFRYVAGIGITGIAGVLVLSEIGVSSAPILGAAGVVAGVEKWVDSSLLLRARLMTQPMKQADVRREYLRRLKLVLDARDHEEPVPAVGLKTPQLSRRSAGG
jgi:small-conductance mechanosensitive channel